ncbi:MAG: nucleoside hydrolase, partial [Planctomycetales bacterium]|nr:nucleoside hydrolase [Planctomycetales bacterium]
MARKVIIDCDPGIDDAVALALALFDPRLEVVAITACAGTVDADQATQNVRALVERLDPPKIPRIGSALDPGQGAAVSNGTLLHGEDG